MSRFTSWVDYQYWVYQSNKQRRAQYKALQIIPPGESPYDIMKVWKEEMILRYGRNGIRHEDCETVTFHVISWGSFMREFRRKLRRIINAIFF